MMDAIDRVVRLEDYRAPDYLIPDVALDISLDPHTTRVLARLKIVRNTGTEAGTALKLDGDGLTPRRIAIEGTALAPDAFRAADDGLTLMQPPADPFTLEIETVIDPKANTQLNGLYLSSATYCTQCEAEGFRRITYFLDRPDVLSVYTTRVDAPRDAAPVLLSNGNLLDSGPLPGGDRHFALWHDPHPKPSYLFALVGGDLGVVSDDFVTASGRKVRLNLYVEHGREARAAYALDALKRAMRWDEEAFGREYDLDLFNIVAVSDFNMGAMENKGLNIFNDKYILADPDTATDGDYTNIEAIIGHEYFHNWTGNRITCRDWFQLCLKEGLTVYRDQEFSADMRSRPVKRIADVRMLMSYQFPEDAGPLAHPVRPQSYREINNFYTATVYEKGAEVVRMLRLVLGEAGFARGIERYFERNDGRAATVEDFLDAFAAATATDLGQFKLWYEQAGTPEVLIRGSYDAAAKRYTLVIEQVVPPTPGQAAKQPMHIPLRVGLVAQDGTDLPLNGDNGAHIEGDVLHVTEQKHSVVFANVAEKPVLSVLRGFSAPVRLSINRDAAELLFLMRRDSDPFNRWRAAQDFAMKQFVEGTEAVRAGNAPVVMPNFFQILMETVGDEGLDAAFRAQVLQLPSEADVAREIGRDVDPEAIHQARKTIRTTAAGQIGAQLVALSESLPVASPFSPDAASAGRRALKNAALDLAAAGLGAEMTARVMAHFEAADNMTDRLAALQTLCALGLETRHAALDAFYRRYRSDPLVIDKWLTLQATVPLDDTLDTVIALTGHEAFSFSNPNRIRSLIGAFATGNQRQFNRADGAGYAFIGDMVLKIDATNPQVSARLLSSFRSWRALEPKRRGKALETLQRVAAKPGISRDLADIANRSLQ